MAWIRRYILFHGKRHPQDMGKPEVEQFLSHLAVERNVAAATQNQALSAILFLYKEVLEKDIGRLDDIAYDGMDLIRQLMHIYENYCFETQILAASIRHVNHLIQCAEAGADVATCPLNVIKGLLKHPLTDQGLEKFLSDYKAVV